MSERGKGNRERRKEREKEPKKDVAPDMQASLDAIRSEFADVLKPGREQPPENPAWKNILKDYGEFPSLAIDQGRRANVPDVLLRKYMFGVIEQHSTKGDFGFVARFMENMNIGTPQQRSLFAQLASSNATVTKLVNDETNVETRDYLLLSPDATVADLARELESEELSEDADAIFYSEVADNFSEELVPKLIDLLSKPEEATAVTLVDFFGRNIEDLAIYLPIRFQTPGKPTKKKKR